MDYLADSVTIIRHFPHSGVIGRSARLVLADADKGKHRIFISVISLVEIMYLSQRNRIAINLEETKRIINESENYFIVDLTSGIVAVAERMKFPELFDRLIIATAESLHLPLLTPDHEITNSNLIKVIWDEPD